jgi:hypothetical protein
MSSGLDRSTRRQLSGTFFCPGTRANLMPEFSVFTADGQTITVRDLAGKVVLVQQDLLTRASKNDASK